MGERDMDNDRKLSHSQNFLKSSEFVSGLIDKTNIGKSDLVIEIGPGKGTITKVLAERASRVLAIEVDRGLARELRDAFSGKRNVEIIEEDFLRWDLPRGPYKVFANIPFNMTSDMVRKLLFSHNPPESTYLIMQDKAAGRFMGPPHGSMSQIPAQLLPFYDMGILSHIGRRNFYPVPRVDAVLASFDKRTSPLIDLSKRSLYNDFVVYGFNQWKPTFLESMKRIFTTRQLDILSRNYGVGNRKPSELSIDQWIGAFETFFQYVPRERQEEVRGAEKRLRSKQGSMLKWHRTR